MRRFFNVFLCFGLVAGFYGCVGNETPTASKAPDSSKGTVTAPSTLNPITSVEIVYFGNSR